MAGLDTADAILKFVSLLLIQIIAFGGNILILAAGLRCKQLRKVSNTFIFNVAIADLLQSIFIMPFGLASVYFKKWPLGTKMCQVVALLKVIITLASVQSLAGISLDRYFYIVRHKETVATKKRLISSIATVWSISTVLAVSPTFGWGELGFDDGKTICTVLFYKSLSHTLAVFCTGLFIPISIMAFCYIKIFNSLRLQRLKIQTRKDNDFVLEIPMQTLATDGSNSEICLRDNTHFSSECFSRSQLENKDPLKGKVQIHIVGQLETDVKRNASSKINPAGVPRHGRILTTKEYHLLRTVSLVILVFLLSWFPYVLFNILRASRAVQDNNTMDTINMWMGFANSAMNPLIYGLLNGQFRSAIAKLF
ncbi:beta-1 adrenergic receptor-like [Rhopilema esculentum]|uniref:beta-1 adrenergic receptor-like n=1 Tax=Rhopilema esculentum TaxID=499914 RepID=UPI0031DEFF14|eukprot:gene16839-8310_t